MSSRLGLGLAALALAACADARDLFRPYVPDLAEMRAVLRLPWPERPLDVAVVLGCPAEPDGGLSPCERCRVDAATRAFARGDARLLLFSGGAAHGPHAEADVMARAALAAGIPEAAILREGHALTTWQNLRFSARIMRERGLRTVLFISTADHLPRARRLAHHYGFDDARSAWLACDPATWGLSAP